MAKVVLAPSARNDLAEIKHYISTELSNPSSAERVITSISKELHDLQRFPEMGRMLDVKIGADPYRYLVCGHYMAFYRVKDDTVYVDRILYGRRDYMALLFGVDKASEDIPEK